MNRGSSLSGLGLSLIFACLISCNKSSSTPQAGGGGAKKQIAVIAKCTMNSYWNAVEAGAEQAGVEANVKIIWTGPDSETNHDQQANMVDNMVNRKVDGIVLAPTNVDALVRPVEAAVSSGVPVVLIDSTVRSDKPVSVIATDNYAAGGQAAEALIAAMGTAHQHGGKVIMLRFLEGSGSTEAREKGFADRIGKEAGLTLVDSMYIKGSGSTTDAAQTADALLRHNIKDSTLDADGIFACNQPTAIAMMETIATFKKQGTAISAKYVGFDSVDALLAGIRDGEISALVVQDPKQMGYLGVKTMLKVLNGEKVDAKIDTPAVTVTKANVDEAKIKAVTLEK